MKNIRCHLEYKTSWFSKHRNWVLRITPKKKFNGTEVKDSPKLVSILPSKSSRIYSRSHVNFFENYYDFILESRGKKFDSSTKIEIINYVTK